MTLHSGETMLDTSITIIIPTCGRRSIDRAVLSYLPQMHPGDELLVMGDTIEGDLIETEAILTKYWPLVRYIPVKHERHSFGHSEINDGLDLAKNSWIVGCDDDDVATPDALASIRAVVSQLDEPVPLLFRFRSYVGHIFWDTPGTVRECHIGGHCLVTPNLPGKVGRYTERYNGDYDYIVDTLSRWPPDSALWVDKLIAIARPSEPWADTTIPKPVLVS